MRLRLNSSVRASSVKNSRQPKISLLDGHESCPSLQLRAGPGQLMWLCCCLCSIYVEVVHARTTTGAHVLCKDMARYDDDVPFVHLH